MKSPRQTWTIVERGSDLARMRKSVRQSALAFLQAEHAADAEVVVARVAKPDRDIYELTFVVAYWRDVSLPEWIDSALSEAVAELGPGKIRLPKAAP